MPAVASFFVTELHEFARINCFFTDEKSIPAFAEAATRRQAINSVNSVIGFPFFT